MGGFGWILHIYTGFNRYRAVFGGMVRYVVIYTSDTYDWLSLAYTAVYCLVVIYIAAIAISVSVFIGQAWTIYPDYLENRLYIGHLHYI